MTRYLFLALPAFLIFLFAYRHLAARRAIFYVIILYYFVSPNISLPLTDYANPRLYLFVILFLASHRMYFKTTLSLLVRAEFRMFLLWTAYILVSYLALGDNPSLSSMYGIIGTVFFYILVVYFVRYSSEDGIRTLLYVILFAYLLNIYGRIPDMLEINGLPLVREATRHAVQGTAAMYSLPILLFLLEYERIISRRTINWIWVLLSSIAVFLSGRRAAIVGYVFIASIFKRGLKHYLLFLLIGLVIFLLAGTEYAEYSLSRVERVLEPENNPTEIRFRMKHIEYSLNAVTDNPIFGAGYLNWGTIAEKYSGVIGYTLATHNGYLRLLSETGFLGTIVFISMILLHLKHTKMRLTGIFEYDLLYSMAVIILGICILAIGSDVFYSRDIYIYLAIITGAKLRLFDASDYSTHPYLN